MDQIHVIRHKVLVERCSIRLVARDMGISRNTVRKYLSQSEQRSAVGAARPTPLKDRTAERIEQIMHELSGRTTAKQRVTGALVLRLLREEGLEVGRTTVQEILAERRREAREVFIPLVHRPGDEFQVDFFEVTVEVAGVRQSAWKFLLHLPYSDHDSVWLYERCNQIAFLDGHVRAFNRLGGVPKRGVYDNLSAAVKRKMGLQRELTDRFRSLCSHYVFEPCFARPGEGHDKGAVENRGKTIRLQHLTPIPRGESLEEIAAQLQRELDEQTETRTNAEGSTVCERLRVEQALFRPLPQRSFAAEVVHPVVPNRQALVTVEGARYSVPSQWSGLPVLAHVGVATIRFECRQESFTVRKAAHGARVVHYLHYREELAKKPQAVRQVAPELLLELGEPYGELWQRLIERYGEAASARVLSMLIGVSIDGKEEQVQRFLQAVLSRTSRTQESPAIGPAVEIPESLARYNVEAACVADYDVLLQGALR